MDIDHSVVVITGASSAIGRATAIELDGRGATLVVTSRDAVALRDVVAECAAAAGAAVALAADVTHEEAVEAVGRRSPRRCAAARGPLRLQEPRR